jgi:hypothetical protein
VENDGYNRDKQVIRAEYCRWFNVALSAMEDTAHVPYRGLKKTDFNPLV